MRQHLQSEERFSSVHEEGRMGPAPGKETLTEGLRQETGAGSKEGGPGKKVAAARVTQPKPPDASLAGAAPAPTGPQAAGPQAAGPQAAGPQAAGAKAGGPTAEHGEMHAESGDMSTPGGGAAAGTPQTGGAGGGAQHVSPKITSATMKTAADGSADTRATVGVGETVTFTSNVAGTWSATKGSITSNNIGTSITWMAHDTATTATIILNDPHGHAATKTMTVYAPQSLTFIENASQNPEYPAKVAGAGMWCNVLVNPTNVSFGNIHIREVPGDASDISGYMLEHFMPHYHPAGGDANWNQIGDNNVLAVRDDVSSADYPPAWSDGGFTWQIPNKYYVGGAGGEYDIAQGSVQSFVIKPDGNVTVTKNGLSTTRTPSAPA